MNDQNRLKKAVATVARREGLIPLKMLTHQKALLGDWLGHRLVKIGTGTQCSFFPEHPSITWWLQRYSQQTALSELEAFTKQINAVEKLLNLSRKQG